jgi:predicted metal-dependent hydrolase
MPIPIDRLIHSKRKTIALIIQSDGSLTVRAPLRMPTVLIQEFVQRHKQWIHKKQDQVRCSPAVQKKIYREGETFLFMGKEYPLILVAHQHPALTFNGSRFQLANAQIINAKEAFIHWYKTQAIKVIAESVKHLVCAHPLGILQHEWNAQFYLAAGHGPSRGDRVRGAA